MTGLLIPTEPIGSIPRPGRLLDAIGKGDATDPALEPLYEEAVRDTIERFEATGVAHFATGGTRTSFWRSRSATRTCP